MVRSMLNILVIPLNSERYVFCVISSIKNIYIFVDSWMCTRGMSYFVLSFLRYIDFFPILYKTKRKKLTFIYYTFIKLQSTKNIDIFYRRNNNKGPEGKQKT